MRWSHPWVCIALAMLLLAAGYGAYAGVLRVRAGWHYRAAGEAIERRAFADASTHLQSCLEVWPDDAALRLLAARTARRAGRLEDAYRELRVHEQQHGDARERTFEYRLLEVQEGNLRDFDMLLTQCAADPDAADSVLTLEALLAGSLNVLIPALQQGKTTLGGPAEPDLVRAHQALDLWLKARPARADQVQGLVWRGHFHAIGNHQAKANEDFLAALALDPDHSEARFFLAKFLQADHPAEALPHFDILLARFPDNVEVRFRTAATYRSLGRFAEAREILDSMLKAEPDAVPMLAERGQLALDMQNAEEAEQFLRRALQLVPHDAKLHLAMLSCLRMSGKYDEARDYETFLERMRGAPVERSGAAGNEASGQRR